MRLSWSTQLMAVLGSFTAGEIARSAMSTIWRTPNSMSCWRVLVGPRSKAPRNSALLAGDRRSPFETVSSGTPAGTKWPTRRTIRMLTPYDLARNTSRLMSMKRT